jgi:hypothetical protein
MWIYTEVEFRARMGEVLFFRDDFIQFRKGGWELIDVKWRDCKIEKETKGVICTFKKRAK